MKTTDRQFTAIIEKRGRWYIGTVEEIPGVNSQGRTLGELRRNLKEAVQLIVESNRSLASREHSEQAKRESITVRVEAVGDEAARFDSSSRGAWL